MSVPSSLLKSHGISEQVNYYFKTTTTSDVKSFKVCGCFSDYYYYDYTREHINSCLLVKTVNIETVFWLVKIMSSVMSLVVGHRTNPVT